MPTFILYTNFNLDQSDAEKSDMLSKLSKFLSDLLVDKPEQYICIKYKYTPNLMFAGKLVTDASASKFAFVQFGSIESFMDSEKIKYFSKAICEFLRAHMNVDPSCTYIEFKDLGITKIGYDGTTFEE